MDGLPIILSLHLQNIIGTHIFGWDNSTVWSLNALRSFKINVKLKAETGSDNIQYTQKLLNVKLSIPKYVLEGNEKIQIE